MAKLIKHTENIIYRAKVYECGEIGYRDVYGHPLKCSKCNFDYTKINLLERESQFIGYMKYCLNCGEKITK